MCGTYHFFGMILIKKAGDCSHLLSFIIPRSIDFSQNICLFCQNISSFVRRLNSDLNTNMNEINRGDVVVVHESVSGGLTYFIKNGICYVTGEFAITENIAGGMYILFENLPESKTLWYFSCGGQNGISVPFAIRGDQLLIYYPENTVQTQQRYDLFVSYPILQ